MCNLISIPALNIPVYAFQQNLKTFSLSNRIKAEEVEANKKVARQEESGKRKYYKW